MLESLNASSLTVAFILWILYLIGLGVFRVYLSPLAAFPGPKIAALTTWYQAYHDIWLRGHYVWRIKEMHAEYGPIIRINPHEIHINDPDFIDELYSGPSKKRDKYKWTPRMMAQTRSVITTIPHELHRKRRAALSPYFSPSQIRRLEPIIHESLTNLLGRLDSFRTSGQIVPITVAYKAMTSDIITDYAFGKSTNYLARDDFNISFFETIESVFEVAHTMLHIAFLGPLVEALPIPLVVKLIPEMGFMQKLKQQWGNKIEEIKQSKDQETGINTIFHGLLNSKLPESEKSSSRLQEEAQLVILAGQDTTGSTMSAITYHVLANPDKLSKLKKELAVATPDPNSLPTLAEVEKLPYLSAVIQESIRLHPGATMRGSRVSPDEPLHYIDGHSIDWNIPPGTPVSMSATLIQTNPQIFPDPLEFRPERWLENPRLDRYLLAFSKGSRICLGITLAYQELTLVTAAIFRKYDLFDGTEKAGPQLALYETIRERDVDMVADLGTPAPTVGSKGVRLLVK